MPERAVLKHYAREQIKGNIPILFIMGLLIMAMTGASVFTVVGPIILMSAFIISNAGIYLGLTRGKTPDFGDLFNGFYVLGKAIGLYLLTSVFTFLWSLLLFVPGVIKALSYSMAPYILAENPHMTSMEALSLCQRMMKGHCGELFVQQLSFIPWAMLVAVTAGIAGVYVIPYISATQANFYAALKTNYHWETPADREGHHEGRIQ